MHRGVLTRLWLLARYLTAKSKAEFIKAKKHTLAVQLICRNTGAPRLTIFIDVEIAPDPRKYANSKKPMPTEREIFVKEKILEQEFVTNNLNIVKCNVILECHIEKNVLSNQESYTCNKCLKRKDHDYFMNNNPHPVRFEVNKDGSTKMNSSVEKSLIFIFRKKWRDSLLWNSCSFEDVQHLYPLFIYPMVSLH
jgi:hypothetical protein